MAKQQPRKVSRRAERRAAALRAKRRKQTLLGGGALIVAALFVVGFVVLAGSGSGGDTALAAEFELERLDGGTAKLSDYRGSPVAVTFMHSW